MVPILRDPAELARALDEASDRADRAERELDRQSREFAQPMGGFPPSVRLGDPKIPRAPTAVQAGDDALPHGPMSVRAKAERTLQRNPLLFHLLTLVLGGGGATVASTAIQDSKPEPADSGKDAYGLVKPAIERLSTQQRAFIEDQKQFNGFVLGVFEASGYKFKRPDGAAAPTPVEIKTTPAIAATVAPVLAPPRPGATPKPARVEIKTGVPEAPKVPDLVKLPETLDGASSPAPE